MIEIDLKRYAEAAKTVIGLGVSREAQTQASVVLRKLEPDMPRLAIVYASFEACTANAIVQALGMVALAPTGQQLYAHNVLINAVRAAELSERLKQRGEVKPLPAMPAHAEDGPPAHRPYWVQS